MFHNKVVVRAGGGMYYNRGELFSYFSPGYAIGTVTGGPFGVNQQLPFVNASSCPVQSQYLYLGYIATCGGTRRGTSRIPTAHLCCHLPTIPRLRTSTTTYPMPAAS
jgi:hypothetical protein